MEVNKKRRFIDYLLFSLSLLYASARSYYLYYSKKRRRSLSEIIIIIMRGNRKKSNYCWERKRNFPHSHSRMAWNNTADNGRWTEQGDLWWQSPETFKFHTLWAIEFPSHSLEQLALNVKIVPPTWNNGCFGINVFMLGTVWPYRAAQSFSLSILCCCV